jgi:hypothetical protein
MVVGRGMRNASETRKAGGETGKRPDKASVDVGGGRSVEM